MGFWGFVLVFANVPSTGENETAFSFSHPDEHKWVMESGTYQIQLGSSSRDIRLTGDVEL